MLKKNKWNLIISSVVILLPMVIGLILWSRLPDTVATHFGSDGEADGWSSKASAVFTMPLLIFAVHWICALITMADPKHKNVEGKPFTMVLWICPLLSVFAGALTYGTALGAEVNVNLLTPMLLGVMFVVIGNYLPKCKQNYTVGIKVPWALNNEENWNHTHRFAGIVWVAGGIVIIATSFLEQPIIFLAVILVIAIAPMGYSYFYFRKHS